MQQERSRGRFTAREKGSRVVEQVALLHAFDSGSQKVVVDDRASTTCAASPNEHLGHDAEHLVQHLGHLEHVGVTLVREHRIRLDPVRIFVGVGDGTCVNIARAIGDEDLVPIGHWAHGGVVVHQRIDLVHVDRETGDLCVTVRVVVGKPIRVCGAARAAADAAFVVPAAAAAHEEHDDIVRCLREIHVERVLAPVAAGRTFGFVLHPGAELGRFKTAAATAVFAAARRKQSQNQAKPKNSSFNHSANPITGIESVERAAEVDDFLRSRSPR